LSPKYNFSLSYNASVERKYLGLPAVVPELHSPVFMFGQIQGKLVGSAPKRRILS
jgi:hypothetical protein